MLLQTYQLDWKADFEALKGIYQNLLKNIGIVIEHVGSTAIPNLMAKPIIDIDISYFSQTDFVIIKKRFESVGYFHNGNQGIKGREVFKKIDNQHPVLDKISHHLYVCHVENEEFKRHILFRDYLNQHEEERKVYENLKIEIAEMANQDRKTYAHIKEIKARPFIERVIENISI